MLKLILWCYTRQEFVKYCFLKFVTLHNGHCGETRKHRGDVWKSNVPYSLQGETRM